ncbi:hypothetical protein MHU86_16796 [Fragilaria crotonensis]|nr:hypothetical protein MHU86_16796 [Fragilaria crotonensis]
MDTTSENVQDEVGLLSSQFPDEGKGVVPPESDVLGEGEIVDSDNVGDDNVEEIKEAEDDGYKRDALTGHEEDGEPILEPNEHDILNGRGASVNAHRGNTTFRALCFSRKPEFEAGNHAAKRRIAAEIVSATKALPGRFLKRKNDKGPWYEVSTEKAILKACQVMRDFQRPDRLILREMASSNGARKRQRTSESTPGVNAPIPAVPLPPIVENPYGVHDHDVLSGRGAFVNGHIGNERFRQLAIERKDRFDAGNYADKRALATEIVGIIRSLDPPGRFLKRSTGNGNPPEKTANDEGWSMYTRGLDGEWEELSDDKAVHKACQVMRDLHRPDRAAERKSYTRRTKNHGIVEEKATREEEVEEGDPDKGGDDSGPDEDANVSAALDGNILAPEEVLERTLPGIVAPADDETLVEDEGKHVEMMSV